MNMPMELPSITKGNPLYFHVQPYIHVLECREVCCVVICTIYVNTGFVEALVNNLGTGGSLLPHGKLRCGLLGCPCISACSCVYLLQYCICVFV